MDDIRVLKWMGLLILLGVSCVAVIFLPFHVLAVGLGVFGLGLARWCTTSPQQRGDRGGTLLVFGALLLLAPGYYLAPFFLQ